MANMITERCVNCGACVDMCPRGGISLGEETHVIDPDLCTECVGHHHTQQCARVCPVDSCVVDPNNPETEAVLFERARKDNPHLELGPETSHYQAKRRSLGSTLRRLGRQISDALQGPNVP